MAVRTSRTSEEASVSIDEQCCTACGLCAKVCGMTLRMENGKVAIQPDQGFGCIGCGQCLAVCPQDCISLYGRTLRVEDRISFDKLVPQSSFEELQSLFLRRRSTRLFLEREVVEETVEKILAAASAAPMGLPPSDVSVLTLRGREKVREFAFDFVEFMEKRRWLFAPPISWLLRPFISKETAEMMEDFMQPLLVQAITAKEQGQDAILYGAPLAMLFQNSAYSDPADASIAATYAMLAGESLGLGTCMIGTVAPMLRHAPALQKKYGILPNRKDGLMVIFGYPQVQYLRGIKRTFAQVNYW
ncbi:nitroreductase family protein [Anaeroarcus burkinensis]|uniref:nitroreductase family protein n=1 Tax=Anaeroarcus burkinensis TaxID=82376 RepID=UPI0003FA7290|nr:nitroreductase family protein [Anaeroarcus burkinensis]